MEADISSGAASVVDLGGSFDEVSLRAVGNTALGVTGFAFDRLADADFLLT